MMASRNRLVTALGVLGMALALVGCSVSKNPVDPYESFNRKVFVANMTVDHFVIKPVTEAYRWAVPEFGREGVANAFHNLGEPSNALNNVMQGKVNDGIATVFRFLVNSTFGIGGLFDVASWIGNEPKDEDFGQTLASWGVPQGSFLMLPLLGPSTTREVFQLPLSVATNPSTYLLANESFWAKAGVMSLDVVQSRNKMIDSGVDEMLNNVVDPYIAMRNAYLQLRRKLTNEAVDEFLGNSQQDKDMSDPSTSGLLPLNLEDD